MMAAEHITDLASDYHLDLLATGVVLLDANLHIQALNLSAENLLEVSASRALGSALEELLETELTQEPFRPPRGARFAAPPE